MPQIPGARIRARRDGGTWQVDAPRIHVLQQLAVASVGAASLSEIDVTLDHWRPPVPGWMGRPGLPGVRELSLAATDRGVRLRITLTTAVDAAILLSAAVRCLRAVPTGDVGPMLTFAAGLPVEGAALAGHVRDVLLPDERRDPHVRRCDILVVPAEAATVSAERARTLVVRPGVWTLDGAAAEISVDPTVHRPIGRRSTGVTGIARGAVAGGRLTISLPDGPRTVADPLTGADAVALRAALAVVCDDAVPTGLARQLQACGVVVAASTEDLPPVDDDLAWQARSVADRRRALREHAPAAALDAWPSVSVVLATHRPQNLEHALEQLAGLRYPRLEAIIGAHGPAVDPGRIAELANGLPFPVHVLALDSSNTLGEALQRCSDRAEGTLVTKLDDDDFYGPEHVWDLVLARMYSGAQVVGKALDWVRLESQDTTVFRPTYAAEKYADFVAGGTMLVSRADLAAVGGWRPVPKSVDRALLDRVLADGGLVYRTHGLGYVYVRHASGHTAAVSDEHFLTKNVARHPGMVRHAEFGTTGAQS